MIRSTILFVAGITGIAYLTITRQAETQPTLIVAFTAMTGLPVFLTHGKKDD